MNSPLTNSSVDWPQQIRSAFILFLKDFAVEMHEKNPDLASAAIANLGGARWSEMTDEEKRPYLEKEDVEEAVRPTVFFDYSDKPKCKCAGAMDSGKSLSERWRDMTEEEKRPYLERENGVEFKAMMEKTWREYLKAMNF